VLVVATAFLWPACDQNKQGPESEEASTPSAAASESSEESSVPDGEEAEQRAAAGATETADAPGDGSKSGPATADAPPGTSPKSAGSTASGPTLKPGTEEQKKLLSKAKKTFLTDDFQAAEPTFRQVLETGPMTGTKMSAYIALAQIHIESGDSGEAIRLLERIPEPGKQVVEVRLMLARAYASREELAEAVDEYRKVLELQPNYLFAYPPLGALYTEMGEDKKAAELYLQYENKLTDLTRALESPDETTAVKRINILDVFASSSDQRVVDAVITALSDPESRVRAKAANTVAELKAITAKPMLEEMAEGDDEYVRKAAASALQRLEDVEKPPERDRVEKEDFQTSESIPE